jgi:hypothetical protein
MEKKLKWWKETGDMLGWLLIGLIIFSVVFCLVTNIINDPFYTLKEQNDLWLELKQPSDNKVINDLYELFLTDKLTFEQKMQLSDESGSSLWKHHTVIYFSQPENFKLVLEGKMNRREMLVKLDYSWKWMEPISSIFLTAALFCFLLFIPTWTVYGVMCLIDKILKKIKMSKKEPKKQN